MCSQKKYTSLFDFRIWKSTSKLFLKGCKEKNSKIRRSFKISLNQTIFRRIEHFFFHFEYYNLIKSPERKYFESPCTVYLLVRKRKTIIKCVRLVLKVKPNTSGIIKRRGHAPITVVRVARPRACSVYVHTYGRDAPLHGAAARAGCKKAITLRESLSRPVRPPRRFRCPPGVRV